MLSVTASRPSVSTAGTLGTESRKIFSKSIAIRTQPGDTSDNKRQVSADRNAFAPRIFASLPRCLLARSRGPSPKSVKNQAGRSPCRRTGSEPFPFKRAAPILRRGHRFYDRPGWTVLPGAGRRSWLGIRAFFRILGSARGFGIWRHSGGSS